MRHVYRHQNSYHNFEHAVACPSCHTSLTLFVTCFCHLSPPLASLLVLRAFRHLSPATLPYAPWLHATLRRHPPSSARCAIPSRRLISCFHRLSPPLASSCVPCKSPPLAPPFWSVYFCPFSRLLLKPGRPRAPFRRSDPHERHRRHELDCPAVPISRSVSVAQRS
jgi:hypothetical protein